MRKINRVVVSGIIVSKDNKILLGKGQPGSVYKDCWLIPGGGVDEGETKIQTLIREVKEEVNLDISNYHHELVEDNATGESEKILKETGEHVLVHMQFFTYRIKVPKNANSIQIAAGDDLAELTWAPIDNMADYPLSPPSINLFKKLGYLPV